jgi:hypothetical protein
MDHRLRSAESRAADNAAVERNARFWRGYSPAGTFLTKVNPQPISTRDKRRRESVSIYLLRFRSKTNPTYSFLKIGITNHIKDRFGFDSHRYDVENIAMAHGFSRGEAKSAEAAMHDKFSEWSHKPQVPLMSKGNTECFIDDRGLQMRIVAEFHKLKHGVDKPIPQVDLRIHGLMLLLDRNHYDPPSMIAAFRGNLKGLGVKVPSKDVLLDHFVRKIKNRPL